MREEFKPYFDDNFMLAPHGEDDILFSAEFAALDIAFTKEMARTCIESVKHGNKFYPNENNQTWSHDMHTGMVCLSKITGLDYHNHWLWFNAWRRIQPWNIAFYLLIMDDIMHQVGLLLMPILSLYMVYNVLVHKYTTNGVLESSEPMIIWLMLQTIEMSLTKRVCNYIVKKRLGGWSAYANTYFVPVHPIATLMREKGL